MKLMKSYRNSLLSGTVIPLAIGAGIGLAARVDEGAQFSLILQTCTNQGCEGAVAVDAAMRRSLRAGEPVRRPPSAQPAGHDHRARVAEGRIGGARCARREMRPLRWPRGAAPGRGTVAFVQQVCAILPCRV